MVAIEHRSKSSNTTTSTSILSPTSNSSVNSATTSVTSTTSLSTKSTTTLTVNKKMSTEPETSTSSKSAVSQRQVEAKVSKKAHKDKDAVAGAGATANNKEESKKALKLDLKGKETDLESLKSPKSPIGGRLTHQTSLSSSVDVEDRKTLREALYQGIFHRHRRTIFAFGSFLRMLRSRNPQYNSIRSASEGEAEVEEVR